jgi:hypothetical protein
VLVPLLLLPPPPPPQEIHPTLASRIIDFNRLFTVLSQSYRRE